MAFRAGQGLENVDLEEAVIRYDPNWKLPWWTGGAIEFVETFLRETKNARVFEYGTGMSSRWLAERCSYYVGVEDNREWHERVNGMLSDLPHANVDLRKGLAYTNCIKDCDDLFDLVVIDGVNRRDTIVAAMPKLRPFGIMVVDDAQAEVHWMMQRPLAPWKRNAFLTTGKDSQHAGKITMVYQKP